MRNVLKRALSVMFAVCMIATLLAVPNVEAKAATVNKKVHIGVKNVYCSDSINVIFKKGEYKLKDVVPSSKNLIVRVTYVYSHSSENSSTLNGETCPYGYARIEMYAKKAGSYKVSFSVIDNKKAVTTKHTVSVKADSNYAIKNVKLGGKEFWNGSELTTKKKASFKVTMNSGYKLKSITVTTYDKNGKAVVKKLTNGKTATLGLYRSKEDYKANSSYYDNYFQNWYMSVLAQTRFTITYTDKYSTQEHTTTYVKYRWPKN